MESDITVVTAGTTHGAPPTGNGEHPSAPPPPVALVSGGKREMDDLSFFLDFPFGVMLEGFKPLWPEV